nr:MAG TPA: hypothetical protein [Caudoviricetes sp.]
MIYFSHKFIPSLITKFSFNIYRKAPKPTVPRACG